MLGQWSWGHSVAVRWNDPYSTMFWARMPMLLLTLALGLALYVFGSRLGNAWGGLLCLAAYVSTPAFLAFGPLVLTDIAVALFCLLTIWAFAEMWRSPDRGTLLRFAFALSGALLSKFSSGLLLFGFLAFVLSLRWLPVAGQPDGPRRTPPMEARPAPLSGEGHIAGRFDRVRGLFRLVVEPADGFA